MDDLLKSVGLHGAGWSDGVGVEIEVVAVATDAAGRRLPVRHETLPSGLNRFVVETLPDSGEVSVGFEYLPKPSTARPAG